MCNTKSFYQHNQAPETKKSFLRVIGAQTFGSRGLRRWGRQGGGGARPSLDQVRLVFVFSFRRPSSMIKRSTTMTSVKVPEFLMLMAVKTIPILLCADRSGNISLHRADFACHSYPDFKSRAEIFDLAFQCFKPFFFATKEHYPFERQIRPKMVRSFIHSSLIVKLQPNPPFDLTFFRRNILR